MQYDPKRKKESWEDEDPIDSNPIFIPEFKPDHSDDLHNLDDESFEKGENPDRNEKDWEKQLEDE